MLDKKLNEVEQKHIIAILKDRFNNNMNRHENLSWDKVESKLMNNLSKLWSLNEMEKTGGEPDVVACEKDTYVFYDCALESPIGRRSFCYDQEALESRKEHKPINSAINMAKEMGTFLLNEEEYKYLQTLGKFDAKTSSWLATPNDIRKLGGAIFGDYRYERVFTYHNGAESYYSSRGFRTSLRV